MTITYAVAGVDLDDSRGRWRLMSDTAVGYGMSLRTSPVSVPGMDGESPTAYEPLDTPSLILDMQVNGASYADMMANYGALLAVLSPTGSVTITKTVDGATVSTIARGKSTTDPTMNPSLFRLRFKATLRLPSVYWRADSQDWTVTNPTSGTSYEVVTLAGTTAPVVDALLLVTGPAPSPKITCAGSWCQLNLTVASGNKALVNLSTWSVRYGSDVTFTGGGTVKSGVLLTSGGPYALRLVPSMRDTDPADTRVQVSMTSTGMSSATKLQIRAKPAYLV